jgi:hypothetical protein
VIPWLKLAFELAVTLSGSLVVFFVTGPKLYGFVGLIMMLVMLGLVFNVRTQNRIEGKESDHDVLLDDHATPIGWRIVVGAGWLALIGLFWPVLPIVIAWRRVNERVDGPEHVASRDSDHL